VARPDWAWLGFGVVSVFAFLNPPSKRQRMYDRIMAESIAA
jgi:hypothetical protein